MYSSIISNEIPYIHFGEKIINCKQHINESKKNCIDLNGNTIDNISTYFSLLFLIVSPLIGFIGHKIVRLFNFDIYFSPLRFSNYWHYYFSGEIVKTKGFKNLKSNKNLNINGIAETYIDILTECQDRSVIYSGRFSEYTISKDTNELENIFISDVKRYSNSKNKFVDVAGDYMQIPYSKVVNMNFRYVEFPQSKRERLTAAILSVFFLISTIILLIAPWFYFKEIGIFRKISGILTSIIALLLFLGLLTSLVVPKSSAKKNEETSYLGLIIFFIIFTVLSLYLFKVIHYFYS